MDFGGTIAVPNSARIVASYDRDDGNSSVTGFENSQVTPMFNIGGAEASLSLSAWLQPVLRFGVDLQGVRHAGIDVGVRLPELTATFTAESGIYISLSALIFSLMVYTCTWLIHCVCAR